MHSSNSSSGKRFKLFAYLFLGLVVFIIVRYFLTSEPKVFVDSNLENPDLRNLENSKLKGNLAEVVDKSLEDTKGTYSVYIKNLKTNEEYKKNENQKFESGSLYKLWVMATVFSQISDGILKEDQVLSQKIATLNSKFDIASDAAELKDGTITQTVKVALEQMITISHNYSSLLLTEKVKIGSIEKFLTKNGLTQSNTGQPPKTTALDTGSFLEKLYRGEIVNPEYSKQMIELLKRQKLNDGLPKYLPKESITVGHKTGEIGWFKHDAGIVFTPKGDYIIVVLSESSSPTGAQERIASLSKTVYEYFNVKEF